MHFKLKLKDGLALVGSEQKGKAGNEEPLRKKFGDENYRIVSQAFEEALRTGKGEGEALNKQAFTFYENFRPSVSQGEKGWGRKGRLDLERVKNIMKE